MKVILSDLNEHVLTAWQALFEGKLEIEIRRENVLDTTCGAFVLPGNSFGFLDRGLELKATERFGIELQDALREKIAADYGGELLVGQAVTVPAGGKDVIYAPIWRVPRDISSTLNAFLAARGAFRTVVKSLPQIEELAIPSLGVDPGGLHPLVSARQLRYALRVLKGKSTSGKNLTQLRRRDRKLRTLPSAGSSADGE